VAEQRPLGVTSTTRRNSYTSRPLINVAYWHLADNPVAPAFVRFWTKADIALTFRYVS
jgi:hypothetical protein